MSFGKMDDYSLSDLAGSGAIMLASIGGLLTIILSSRCYCKFRLGLTDNCNICMCERKPPPDAENPKGKSDKDKDKNKDPKDKDKTDIESEEEPIIPTPRRTPTPHAAPPLAEVPNTEPVESISLA